MEKKPLSDYIALLEENGLIVSKNIKKEETLRKIVGNVTYDSRRVTDGSIFICKGSHFREEYLASAYEKGALAAVSETDYCTGGDIITVNDIRKAISLLGNMYYGGVQNSIFSIGITGTKGKSTTAYYVKACLDEYMKSAGKPECAVISSIDTYDGKQKFESHLTTPEPLELFEHFSNACESGISHLVMEVSSQALKYGRVDGFTYDIGCFTNIGTDHISPIEHSSFEDYLDSKKKIFDICRTACINSDMDCFEEVYKSAEGKCAIVTYGEAEGSTVRCRDIRKEDDGIYFTVITPNEEMRMSITMPGLFNVSNAMAAAAILYSAGIPLSFVKAGLRNARASGRMQLYSSLDGKIKVIVDYAHNKMSFEALYDSVRKEYPGRKILTVFGCPGKKAFLRRHDLGVASGENSDYVILTEEDSGEEPFESIANDIAENIKGCPFEKIEDRGEAIRKAILGIFGEDRIILITGKGEETRQKRGIEYIDCPSDVEYTLKCLEEYDRR